jgi:transposase
MKIKVLGIDLGKSIFHLFGVDERGQAVLRKKLTRSKLMSFMANLPPCLVGMEACAGSHHLARVFTTHGHEARLMSPQFVKPYVKSNKNDYLDAEAICEAVQRPTMRFVPMKSVDQQDIQTLHRARSRAVSNRTAQANQIRGLLLEYGIVVAQGIRVLRQRLPAILEDAENELSMATREVLVELREELVHLDERVAWYDARIAAEARSEPCQRLQTIPGVGPLVATALVSAVGDGQAFRNGRELSAWLGLVPRQRSTGGRSLLLGISKRGDTYLRSLLIHGARAALRHAGKRNDHRSRWGCALAARRGKNIAAVGLANKIARTAWVLLTQKEQYQLTAA